MGSSLSRGTRIHENRGLLGGQRGRHVACRGDRRAGAGHYSLGCRSGAAHAGTALTSPVGGGIVRTGRGRENRTRAGRSRMAEAAKVSRPIRVAVVDDHTLFREGLRLMIELEPDLAFAGEASTVDEAVALCARVRPDLILLDLRLADARGVDVLSRIVAVPGAPRALVVTAFPEEQDIGQAIRLGAGGVVVKDATRETMLAAIRAVSAGQRWLPPDLSAKVITTLSQAPHASVAERLRLLTPRERDIVGLVAEGLKNREIAERLSIAEKTIKGHLTSVFDKLGVEDRLELALLAVKLHLTLDRGR
jgi:two-component system, NarL family, response regulator DevR